MERIFRIFRNFQFSRNFHPLVGTFQGRKIMFRQPRDNHRSLEGDIKIRFLFDLLTFHGIHSHGSRGFLPVLYIYIYTHEPFIARPVHRNSVDLAKLRANLFSPSLLSAPLKRVFPRRMRGIHLLFLRNIRVFDTRDASIWG